jgi:NitT/TauT family transport system permease protein
MTGTTARKLLIVLALLVAWEAWTRLFKVSPLLFPAATTVMAAFGRSIANGEIPGYATQSLRILLTGMAFGTAIALILTTLAVTTRLGAISCRRSRRCSTRCLPSR